MTNPSAQSLISPSPVDAALLSIQTRLEGLDWLDTAYGRCEKLKREKEGKVIQFPAIYAQGKEYLELFPDEHLGNFSFFEIVDGWDYSGDIRRVGFNLILWFNFESVFPDDYQQRNQMDVAEKIIKILEKSYPGSSINLGKIYLTPDEIYRGYTSREISQQFLMRPYGGLRITGNLFVNKHSIC